MGTSEGAYIHPVMGCVQARKRKAQLQARLCACIGCNAVGAQTPLLGNKHTSTKVHCRRRRRPVQWRPSPGRALFKPTSPYTLEGRACCRKGMLKLGGEGAAARRLRWWGLGHTCVRHRVPAHWVPDDMQLPLQSTCASTAVMLTTCYSLAPSTKVGAGHLLRRHRCAMKCAVGA